MEHAQKAAWGMFLNTGKSVGGEFGKGRNPVLHKWEIGRGSEGKTMAKNPKNLSYTHLGQQ